VAGLTAQERLQPSLLDRLTDSEPSSGREALDARVLNRNQLRAAVLRDLSWLFNATCEEPDPMSPDRERVELWREVPEAAGSVANFGIPAMSGRSITRLSFPMIEQGVRQAIVRFEPRIDPKTLKVEISNDPSEAMRPASLRIVIRGQMWNQPVPLELLLSADVDVDTGQAAVRDMRT
jgi:type VI secretion system protein ImpF